MWQESKPPPPRTRPRPPRRRPPLSISCLLLAALTLAFLLTSILAASASEHELRPHLNASTSAPLTTTTTTDYHHHPRTPLLPAHLTTPLFDVLHVASLRLREIPAALHTFGAWGLSIFRAPVGFAPDACTRTAKHLRLTVRGQYDATSILTAAICDHLASHTHADHVEHAKYPWSRVGDFLARQFWEERKSGGIKPSPDSAKKISSPTTPSSSSSSSSTLFRDHDHDHDLRINLGRDMDLDGGTTLGHPVHDGRPLVVSLHGPPGVGKSLTHRVLAHTLWRVRDKERHMCPGPACPGYYRIFGVDYTTGDQAGQLHALRQSLVRHLRRYPEALVVIEEYDRMDCVTRGFIRQLLDRGDLGAGGAGVWGTTTEEPLPGNRRGTVGPLRAPRGTRRNRRKDNNT